MTTAGRKRKPEVLTKQLEEEIRGSPTQDQKIRPLCNGQSARTDALKSALNVLPTAIVDQQKQKKNSILASPDESPGKDKKQIPNQKRSSDEKDEDGSALAANQLPPKAIQGLAASEHTASQKQQEETKNDDAAAAAEGSAAKKSKPSVSGAKAQKDSPNGPAQGPVEGSTFREKLDEQRRGESPGSEASPSTITKMKNTAPVASTV